MGALGPRVRWGILGAGRMAGEFAHGLHRLRDAELVAVGSRDRGRAEAFALALGAPRAYGSYEQLVSDSGVDVVYVATPNSLHREHCLLALAAGKAVLCEKPFATNGREARSVVAFARKSRLFCMEAMWSRFLPLVERAETLVREGTLGDPLAFQADFGLAVASRDSPVFRPELGGGALLDLGVYLLAMARSFLGPPLEVTGRAHLGQTGVDEQASMLLRHSGDRHSLLFASIRSETRAAAVVLGTTGRLRIHPPFYRPHRVSVERFKSVPGGSARGPSQASTPTPRLKALLRPVYQRFEGVLSAIARRPEIDIFEPIEGNGYHHEAAEVARCLRAGDLESPRMPLDETIAIAETLGQLRDQWGIRPSSE